MKKKLIIGFAVIAVILIPVKKVYKDGYGLKRRIQKWWMDARRKENKNLPL